MSRGVHIIVVCDVCRSREAVVFQKHTGLRLCRECFIRDVEKRVLNEIKRFKMFLDNERVLLALSGGKDSFVLLDILSKTHDTSKLGGVTVVEGIRGYNRIEDLEQLKNIARERGVELHIVHVKDLAGYSVDELVERSREKNLKISPCTFCGIYRRRGINRVARELGYDKVATAHNLDDEVQTLFINLLRGDENRIITLHPLRNNPSELLVPRVKPLRKIYEYETARYAYLKGYKPQEVECPYLSLTPSLRARIREILYVLEEERPGILLKILEEYDKLYEERALKTRVNLWTCEICGEPTNPGRKICKSCELLIRVGLIAINRSSFWEYASR
ncbi:MAG: TIGR00269 family protein [Sulfolobales archaeon]